MCHIKIIEHYYVVCGHTSTRTQETPCRPDVRMIDDVPDCCDLDIEASFPYLDEPCPYCSDHWIGRVADSGELIWERRTGVIFPDCG